MNHKYFSLYKTNESTHKNPPINEQLVQALAYQVGGQRSVVPPDSLDSLAVDFVVGVGVGGVVQTGVPLLVDQQVREVNLQVVRVCLGWW